MCSLPKKSFENELLTPFIPKPNVIVCAAKSDVSLYPNLEQSAAPAERAYAFLINKNAIKNVSTDARLKLDITGAQLNQTAFVDGMKNQLLSRWRACWMDMCYLRIVSFHDGTGLVISNACMTADSKILLPCVARNLADCRFPDMRFIHLQLKLDFAPVAPGASGGTISKAMCYIELPQSSIDFVNGVGVIRSLVTFHGTADVRTLSVHDLWTEVLDQGP